MEPTKITRVIALDPGTGSSSGFGLAIFDPTNQDIVHHDALWPMMSRPTIHRIKSIREQLVDNINKYVTGETIVAIESFVMRGKSGETLQRMIGAALTAVPYRVKIVEVQNTSMKKWVGNTGKADKQQVMKGVQKYFALNPLSLVKITKLIDEDQDDILDAFGIGICAVKGDLRR